MTQLPYCLISGVRFGADALLALSEAGSAPALVVCYPEELSHRSGYSDLRAIAERLELPALAATDINSPRIVDELRRYSLDAAVVCGWSELIRGSTLAHFRHGVFGLHPTALPLGRGRAPIPWTLLKGLRSSAVSLFKLDEDVDSGPLVEQVQFEVEDDDDAATVYEKVSEIQSRLLVKYIDGIVGGTVPVFDQVGHPTYWPKRDDQDGRIDWGWGARRISNTVRALTDPYPGAWTTHEAVKLRVWKARVVNTDGKSLVPGTILNCTWAVDSCEITVACGNDEAVLLDHVTVDGSSLGSDRDAQRMTALTPGLRLG